MRTRRKAKYVWIRGVNNNVQAVTQPAFQLYDLMSEYRTLAGVTLNIPEFTLWRLRIRVSISFGLSPLTFTANSGAHIAMFVDDLDFPTSVNPVAHPFNEQFLMWDEYFVSEQVVNSPVANPPTAANLFAGYRQYDIKSHRRLRNLNDTVLLTISPTGNVEQLTSSIVFSMLMRQS